MAMRKEHVNDEADREESIDVDTIPELARLAEEVAKTGRPRALVRDGVKIAVLEPLRPAKPARRPRRKLTEEEKLAAFRAAAGGWKDIVDTDRLLADIYASRDQPPKPPVEL